MKMLNKTFPRITLDRAIYAVFGSAVLLEYLFSFDASRSVIVQLQFLLIGALAIAGFIMDGRFLSVNKIVHIFMFLFMYYAPFHQYLVTVSFWSIGCFSDSEYRIANWLILLFYAIYFGFQWLLSRKKEEKVKKPAACIPLPPMALYMMTAVSIISVAVLLCMGEVFSLSKETGDDSALYSVILKVLRYLSVSALMLCVLAWKRGGFACKALSEKICLGLLVFCVLFIFFPLGGAINRYLLFGTYLALVAAVFYKFKYKSLVLVAFVVGFALVFPAFNFFKTHSMRDLGQFVLGGFDATHQDYDAHYMFMATIRYVKNEGILFGKNILTALLCVVPRSIWPQKLLPSGHIVSGSLNASFNNVSCPLFGEFYLAFHIPGIIVGTVVFVLVIMFLEKQADKGNILFEGLYYMILGIMLVTLRGALLPFTSYTISIAIPLIFNYSLMRVVLKCQKMKK